MNSRWSTNPIKRDGQIASIRPNVAGDIEILKSLGRYTVLTADDIAALTRRSYRAVIARLNLLKRKPNELIQVHRSQLESPRMYQWAAQALHLSPRGIAKLHDIGFEPCTEKPSTHFIHQLTENQVAASFEIGVRERLIPFSEILPTTPQATQESAEPHAIRVAFSYKGKDYNYNLTPDGRPFGISYPNDTYRFCVLEVDCASEPLVSSNRDRQAIETKFAAYLSVLEQGLYESHWGVGRVELLVGRKQCLQRTLAVEREVLNRLLPLIAVMKIHPCQRRSFENSHTDVLAHPRLSSRRDVQIERGKEICDRLGDPLFGVRAVMVPKRFAQLCAGIRMHGNATALCKFCNVPIQLLETERTSRRSF